MQGGRLYVNLQGLPDRRARIRINTLLNGKPVAEVDLSANHPRMLMALENQKLPEGKRRSSKNSFKTGKSLETREMLKQLNKLLKAQKKLLIW